jgi:two-component system NtrC family sensor kinase
MKTPASGEGDAQGALGAAAGLGAMAPIAAVEAPSPIHPAPAVPARILYAEDDPQVRRVASLVLNRAGYIVTPVEDGLQAWEALHLREFDLLVTDNDMPRLSGLQLAVRIRREGMRLPIVIASGSANMMKGPEIAGLQLACLLQKPFDASLLASLVKTALDAGGVSDLGVEAPDPPLVVSDGSEERPSF